ncbi:MAG: Gfo/Idh/MocA family oxidoreductase [Chitinophagales bacterium]|nr:Gfo/Idh/MocA family oxidoreductase [Chitinophagales bacterium]MDW8418223.1 Gfo/Idh/MocA family oxidoreductase [Chitinophagales bacterium]
MAKKVRIGVLGVGHLGRIHLKLLREMTCYDITGFYDPDERNASRAEREFGIRRFESAHALIDNSDAVDIVATTTAHYMLAKEAITKGKHLFVEKPLAATVREAHELMKLVDEARVKAMVGHVERFNPAILALDRKNLRPLFIEVHRLAEFNPRGTDVSVVLDLMIHDLDIILSIVRGNVKRVSASGVAIISATPDIANARIEFDNGCVANVTASRVSVKSMRKMRIFQPGAYISIDFLKKKSDVFRLEDKAPVSQNGNVNHLEIELPGQSKKYITYETVNRSDVNAIQTELELFYQSIAHHKAVPVTFEDGYRAMHLAQQILDKINAQLVVKKGIG